MPLTVPERRRLISYHVSSSIFIYFFSIMDFSNLKGNDNNKKITVVKNGKTFHSLHMALDTIMQQSQINL